MVNSSKAVNTSTDDQNLKPGLQELSETKLEIFEDEFGKWKWRLLSNGVVIDASTIGCRTRTYCKYCACQRGYCLN